MTSPYRHMRAELHAMYEGAPCMREREVRALTYAAHVRCSHTLPNVRGRLGRACIYIAPARDIHLHRVARERGCVSERVRRRGGLRRVRKGKWEAGGEEGRRPGREERRARSACSAQRVGASRWRGALLLPNRRSGRRLGSCVSPRGQPCVHYRRGRVGAASFGAADLVVCV